MRSFLTTLLLLGLCAALPAQDTVPPPSPAAPAKPAAPAAAPPAPPAAPAAPPEIPAAPKAFIDNYKDFVRQQVDKRAQVDSQQKFKEYLEWQTATVDTLLGQAPAGPDLSAAERQALGHLQQLKGDHAKAVELFQAALAADPEYVEAAARMMTSLIETGQPAEAEALYQKYGARIPGENASELLFALGMGFSQTGAFDKADTYLRQALDRDLPADFKAYIMEMVAENLVNANRKDDAVAFLKERIGQAGDDPNIAGGLQAKLNQLASIGSPAAELVAGRWVGDRKASLAELKGKVVIIDFWATWCGPCRMAMPNLKKLYEAHHGQGLEIIGLTSYYGNYTDGKKREPNVSREREFELVSEFVATNSLPWLVALADDNANHKNYNVTGIPHLVVIDRQGLVRKVEVGFNPNSKKLESFVELLLKQ